MTPEEIATEIIKYSQENELHQDPVAKIYSAMKKVDQTVMAKMLELRKASKSS